MQHHSKGIAYKWIQVALKRLPKCLRYTRNCLFFSNRTLSSKLGGGCIHLTRIAQVHGLGSPVFYVQLYCCSPWHDVYIFLYQTLPFFSKARTQGYNYYVHFLAHTACSCGEKAYPPWVSINEQYKYRKSIVLSLSSAIVYISSQMQMRAPGSQMLSRNAT